jgi:hypothetical protein
MPRQTAAVLSDRAVDYKFRARPACCAVQQARFAIAASAALYAPRRLRQVASAMPSNRLDVAFAVRH